MSWIELRGMWNKNILDLDAKEIAEAQRVLAKYELRVTDMRPPLFKVDWPGAPASKFSPKRDKFQPTSVLRSRTMCSATASNRKTVSDRPRPLFRFLAPGRPSSVSQSDQTRNCATPRRWLQIRDQAGYGNEMTCNTATAAEAPRCSRDPRSKFIAQLGSRKRSRAGETPFPDGYRLLPKGASATAIARM